MFGDQLYQKSTGQYIKDVSDRLENTIANLGNFAYSSVTNIAEKLVNPFTANETRKNLPVVVALQRMQKDVDFLDEVATRTPQLTKLEFAVLFSSVLVSAISPSVLSIKIVEVIVPSMAALAASVGISAEYVGKVAVSNGKEISALAIQAAAEAESVLAQAERNKAVLPLCVGIATTASAFALLAPNFLTEFSSRFSVQIITEIYLICPLIAVLAAAIGGLASQESRSLAAKAAGIGNRRFAMSKSVGKTWLSASEQVEQNAERLTGKWKSFVIGVILAPVIAISVPGTLALKSIICAAIAAAQAAYYLSIAEYSLAEAVDTVALKSRCAAVSDTYANQGTRAGAILPFTSALAGLCAAASAAVVETLPFIHVTEVQTLISIIFPMGAALFGAAASVSKARCEADAAASLEAVQMLGNGNNNDNNRDPLANVKRLIEISIGTSYTYLAIRSKQLFNLIRSGNLMKKVSRWFFKKFYNNIASLYGIRTKPNNS